MLRNATYRLEKLDSDLLFYAFIKILEWLN